MLRVPAIQQFNGSDFSVRIPLPFYIDQQIDTFVADVVHSHHPFLLGDTAIRVARKRDLPLVFTHHTLYEQYTHCVPLDSDTLKDFVMRLATMYANHCKRIVAPSRSIALLLRDRGVRRPIEEIPTGVDISFFAGGNGKKFRRDANLLEDALVIGHVGRLAPALFGNWEWAESAGNKTDIRGPAPGRQAASVRGGQRRPVERRLQRNGSFLL